MKFREILEKAGEREEAPEQEKEGKGALTQKGGYGSSQAKEAPIEGEIASEHDFFWRREDLKLVRVKNDRAFFRLETNIKALVVPMERFGAGEIPARLMNISAGGVGIGTKCQCCQEDKLLLKVRLLAGEEEWNLFCQIVRFEERGSAGFVYGCRLIELTEKEEETLMESIERLRYELRG